MDVGSVKGNQVLFEINDQTVRLIRAQRQQGAGIQTVAVAQGSTDSSHEFRGTKRLGDVIVCAAVRRKDFFLFLGTCGNDDDGNACPGADLADDVNTVHVGQSEIQQYEVRADGSDQGQPDSHAFGTVGGSVSGIGCAVKKRFPFIRRDADTVIPDMEAHVVRLGFYAAGDGALAAGMQYRVFQQVNQYLFD